MPHPNVLHSLLKQSPWLNNLYYVYCIKTHFWLELDNSDKYPWKPDFDYTHTPEEIKWMPVHENSVFIDQNISYPFSLLSLLLQSEALPNSDTADSSVSRSHRCCRKAPRSGVNIDCWASGHIQDSKIGQRWDFHSHRPFAGTLHIHSVVGRQS